MKHINRIISISAALGVMLVVTPSAHATAQTLYEEAATTAPSILSSVAFILTVMLMFAAMAFAVRLAHTGKLNLPWAVLSIVLSAFAVIVCIIGSSVGSLYSKPTGNPADTVTKFYDALIAGDYTTAYSCLSDYTGLGLETEPADANAALIYDALKESYEYTLADTAKVDKLSATQSVRFKYLDLESLEASVEDGVKRNLEKIVKARPGSEVYDENNKYLPSVTAEAYNESLQFVLSHASSYYTATAIDIELVYTNGQWLIVTNQAMLNALMGGVAY